MYERLSSQFFNCSEVISTFCPSPRFRSPPSLRSMRTNRRRRRRRGPSGAGRRGRPSRNSSSRSSTFPARYCCICPQTPTNGSQWYKPTRSIPFSHFQSADRLSLPKAFMHGATVIGPSRFSSLRFPALSFRFTLSFACLIPSFRSIVSVI